MTDEDKNPASAGDEDVSALWDEVKFPGDKTEDSAKPKAPSEEAAEAEAQPTEPDDEQSPPSDEGRDEDDGEVEVDWSAVPEVARREYEKIAAENKTLAEKNRRHALRQSGLEQRLREASRPPDPEKKERAGDDPSDHVAEDYPEIAEWMKRQIEPMVTQMSRLTAEQQQRASAILDENHAKFYAGLPSPDFLEKNMEAWNDWIEGEASVRDAEIVRLNQSGFVDPDASLRVVENFRRFIGDGSPPPDTGKPQQPDRRGRQLASASAPRTSSRSAQSGIPRNADPATIWDMTEV